MKLYLIGPKLYSIQCRLAFNLPILLNICDEALGHLPENTKVTLAKNVAVTLPFGVSICLRTGQMFCKPTVGKKTVYHLDNSVRRGEENESLRMENGE